MTNFTSATTVKALRKPRQCYWCPEPLLVGTLGVKIAGSWDGQFAVVYVHAECEQAWMSDPCNLDEEGCPYVHARGKTCAEAASEPDLRQAIP